MLSLEAARERLRAYGQEHLLAFCDQLQEAERDALLADVDAIDLPALARLIQTHVRAQPPGHVPSDVQPPGILPAAPRDEQRSAYDAARRRGRQLIAAGRVAALVVAGGEGTRLGIEGPKGFVPATPVKGKSLFQVFAEQVRATSARYGSAVPLYVMTSPANDAETRAYFEANGHFGLPPGDVFFFAQGRMPAIGLDGKILLARKGRIALGPDGHGGCLAALADSGALDDMARRGAELISYFQVDNPLVRCVDPLFIGLHAEAGAEMSAKAIPKRQPMEKLGNFCLVDGKITVIEYSDLPENLARATRDDGTLRFSAGSIAIHVFSRSFVERLTAAAGCELPLHRAVKKVAYVDPAGATIMPPAANAVKLERFIFDALPLADKTVILQTLRSEEFSPIKNAAGTDSLETCLHDQVRRAAEWLETAGVPVPRDAQGEVATAVEISPMFALDADELAEKVDPGMKIMPGQELYLE